VAGYRKKRRGPQGPNKNEKKVMRSRDAEKQAIIAGALGEKFPSIKHLNIQLVIRGAQQQLLDQKSLSMGPEDPCLFSTPCPGRCGTGSFDFSGKVEETAAARLPASESSGKCAKPIFVGSSELCGCEIKCRMEVDYFPVEEDAPQEPSAPPAQEDGPPVAAE
jgi:hypothetical protein